MADILENPVDLIDDAYEQEIQVEQEMIEVVAYRSYNQLDDKPQINGVELVGNKTSSDLGITAQIESVVNSEAQARVQADNTLQNKIDTEKLARQQADSTLQGRIDAEETARQQADNGLQSQIDAITSQSDVVDVVANYAALQAYDTSSLSDNDVIKVLDDETHEDALTYYRWSTTTQTWAYIGQEAPYYSKGQMDAMLQGKQDKLTAGANIQIENGTISATDTTYTAGNGLNLNGTEFSADTDVLATKSDLESYYTKPETDNLLAPKLEAEVVEELPATGTEGKLYLTPKAHTTQTATGNPITATVAEDAGALESFQLDGDTFQQTYEGKNLFDYANANARVGYILNDNGVEITDNSGGYTRNYSSVVPNSDYILSGLDTVGGKTRMVYFYDSNKQFLSRTAPITTGSPTLIFTTPANCYFVNIQMFIPNDTDMSAWQLEAGSTATSFEPYVGGTPSPNPDYPQPIRTVTGEQTVEIVGKNLFDKTSQISNGYTYSATGSIDSLSTSSVQESYISVSPSTTYTLHTDATSSQTTNFRVFICEYDSSKGFIQRDAPAQTTSNTNTITTTANTYFVRLCFSTVGIDTLQFEKSASPTTYAPYSKQTLPLDLGSIELCKIGDYQDYIYKDGEDWKVHKDTGKEILQSSGWALRTDSAVTDGSVFRYLDYVAGKFPTNGQGLSSHFRVVASTNILNTIRFIDTNGYGFNVSIANSVIGVESGDSYQTKANKFMAWLSENSVSVYYQLATPTDTVITDTTLIAQLEAIRTASLENGTNTITNTATGSNLAGDMEIGYYGFAPRNRYDKWLWLDINNEYEQIGS